MLNLLVSSTCQLRVIAYLRLAISHWCSKVGAVADNTLRAGFSFKGLAPLSAQDGVVSCFDFFLEISRDLQRLLRASD